MSSGQNSSWTWSSARHLLSRAGFGGKASEIQEFLDLGLEKSVDTLLKGSSIKLTPPAWLEEDMKFDVAKIRSMTPDEKLAFQRSERQHTRELVGIWTRMMIASPTPADMLHQRMMFFWHSHFATSVQKVKGPPFIFQQMDLFQNNALGNYGEFLHLIIRDPAMLRYLDNDQNKKGSPNENLARELMELFSLGQGNYSEDDIREGARALTGWGARPYEFFLNRKSHDSGTKKIFGQEGDFDGDGFVDLILKQPACAEFMAGKLWACFAGEVEKKSVVKELAAKFRDSKYDIKTLLRALFTHPEFYSADVVGTQIKNPVQLIVGTARTLGLPTNNMQFFGNMFLVMGQVPYLPPNVKGWPEGRNWVDTSRLVTRYGFARLIGEGKIPAEIDPRLNGDMELEGGMEMQAMGEEMESMVNEASTQAKVPRQGARADKKEEKFPNVKKVLKGKGSAMPMNLNMNFDAEKLVAAKGTPEEQVDQIIRLLLATPPTDEERIKIVEDFKNSLSTKKRNEAVRLMIEQVMLLPLYQLA